MAILLALLAAAANALATILQRIGVEEASPAPGSTRSLMASVLRRPIWFAGLGLTTASFFLQAIALSLGDLSTVQPVMVTEIVFLVLVLGSWFRRTLGWRELVGATGTAAGLGVFLALSAARGGHGRPSHLDWALLLLACGGAVALAAGAARRGPRWWRAAAYGVAAGICFALTAAFVKSAADQWQHGPLTLLVHFEAYGVAVSGLAGLVLSQHALEAGPVAASQSALLIVNPLSSIVIGVWLFGDHLHAFGARAGLEGAALFVMFTALFVLSGSPLVATGAEERLTEQRPYERVVTSSPT
ncbi:MAG TPA: DMT family transporter [Acidimicrobiales bacterium]|jgi:drug/metabolite transporter (DMT)-like permease|nr:DMT family transporter [Acidimicrobiales bacterium]